MNNALCIIGPYDVDYLNRFFFHFSMKAEATIYPRRCLMCTNPYSLANASRRKGKFCNKKRGFIWAVKSKGSFAFIHILFPSLSRFFCCRMLHSICIFIVAHFVDSFSMPVGPSGSLALPFVIVSPEQLRWLWNVFASVLGVMHTPK